MFDYLVIHGFKLKYGLTVQDYSFRDRQNDAQAFALAMAGPLDIPLPWNGLGWLVLAFLVQVLARCTHCNHMRRHERGFWAAGSIVVY